MGRKKLGFNDHRIIGEVVYIMLTQGKIGIIDLKDLEKVRKYHWYTVKLRNCSYYVETNIKDGDKWKNLRIHSLIMDVANPKVEVVHINGNNFDNTRQNLKVADRHLSLIPKRTYNKYKINGDEVIIYLKHNRQTIMDLEDFERVKKFYWYADDDGYVTTLFMIKGKTKRLILHRVIMNITNPKIHIDHRDHDPLNNRKQNIRLCTHQQNMLNRRPDRNTSSKYKGVSLHKTAKKWEAYISFEGKRMLLGYFEDEIRAAEVYDEAARRYHREFSYLNFPDKEGEE